MYFYSLSSHSHQHLDSFSLSLHRIAVLCYFGVVGPLLALRVWRTLDDARAAKTLPVPAPPRYPTPDQTVVAAVIHIKVVIALSTHAFAWAESNPFSAKVCLVSSTTAGEVPSLVVVDLVGELNESPGEGWFGNRIGYSVNNPSRSSCKNVLYLLIVVGVTVAEGNFGLKYLLQVLGSSKVRYLITNAEITRATSLPKMIVATVQGSIPERAREITIVVTKALSAAGSAMLPKTVYFPVLRAIQPSRRSVIEAMNSRVQAGTKLCVATR